MIVSKLRMFCKEIIRPVLCIVYSGVELFI